MLINVTTLPTACLRISGSSCDGKPSNGEESLCCPLQQRPIGPRTSKPTHAVLTRYSRGTQGALTAYSLRTHCVLTVTGCSLGAHGVLRSKGRYGTAVRATRRRRRSAPSTGSAPVGGYSRGARVVLTGYSRHHQACRRTTWRCSAGLCQFFRCRTISNIEIGTVTTCLPCPHAAWCLW